MNNLIENPTWYRYEQTPHRQGSPIKIDAILAERMKSFLSTRSVRPMTQREIIRRSRKGK